MKRNPRKVKWTKAYRVLHGKELTADSIFDFERRRNRPLKYNREVVHATLSAMKSIEDIRTRREARFYESRMKGTDEARRQRDKRELAQQVHISRAPGALSEDRTAMKLPQQKVELNQSLHKEKSYD